MLKDINLRKIGMMFLIFSLVFTGMGLSFGTPVSYAAEGETSSGVYVSSGGSNTTGDGTKENPYATLYAAYQAITANGTIYVMDDITLSSVGNGKFLEFLGGKQITITTASGAPKTAVIERNGSGTLFDLHNGQLTLRNIIIDGMGTASAGRIVNVYNNSSLTIEEGTILRNNNIINNLPASAIFLRDAESTVKMTGGEIRDNKYGSTSATVAVLMNKGKFTMTGGIITKNSGGGVQVAGGEFFLSGAAQITENTIESSGKLIDRNVNLLDTNLLNLSGDFTGEAGITAQNRMTAGSQFGKATGDRLTGLESQIFADSGALLASYDENDALVWRAFKNELSQPSTDGEKTGKNPTLSGVTEPFANVTIKIVSATDQSIVIIEERTADENGNWELPVVEALETGAYTITVTASNNKTQSETVTRQFVVEDKTALQEKVDEITAENLVETEYTEESWAKLQQALQEADRVLKDSAATQEQVNEALTALNNAYDSLEPIVAPTPGGVSDHLISWVNVGNSAVINGNKIDQLTDLADGGAWRPSGTANDNVPNALNFNSGIQIDSKKGYYTRSANDFNKNATSAREMFSVQASDNYDGFPWELGGSYSAKAIYGEGNGKNIRTYFGRSAGHLDVNAGNYELKNGAMLNIWSAPGDWALSLNGKNLRSEDSNTPNFTSPVSSTYYFGAGHNSRFYGKMSETILYNRKLTDEERNKVNSYLALKYGLTLKDENNSPIDYVASDGSTMWTASSNTGYGNRITGVGRDEAGALYQKQSKSQVDGANVTIAVGNAIEETNALNTNEIAKDKSFFVFSDNGGEVKFVAPTTKDAENLKRIERIYKVEKTNWQDTEITLQIDKAAGASDWPLYLVVSTDDQFDQNDAFHLVTDGTVTLNSAEIADGAYFTIAATVPVPTAATIAQTVADGNKITVTFDRGVALTDLTGFTITVDGTPVANGGLTFKVDENDATKLMITLPAGTDVTDKTVNISYNGSGNVKGTNGVPVDPFDKNVEYSGATLTITEPSIDPITVAKPEIKGTAEVGAKVKVVIKNQDQEVDVSDEITVDENGNWVFIPNANLTDGKYTIEVTATKDGNTVTKTKEINVAIPVPTVDMTSPTGTVSTGKPEFKGTATPGAKVTVKVAEGIELTATADENGNWSVTPTTDIPNGDYNVVVTAEKDGKVSEPITKAIKVDTAALNVDMTSPTGTVTTGKPEFKGTATPGAKVTVKVAEGIELTATADENGNWSVTPTTDIPNGDYNVVVTAEKDGKVSEPITKAIKVDTAALNVDMTSPTGTVTTGKPEFKGTATPGAKVTVKVAEGIELTATADENGNWSVTPTTDIPDGDYNVVVTAEKDGKVSEPITKAIKVDAATLTVAIEQPTGSKVSNAKPTFKGTSTPGSVVTVEIKDKAGNVVDSPTVTVDADGNWTFTPTNNLTDGQYTVEVTATKDGKSTKATKSITVDTAPTLPSVDKTALQAKVDQIKDENLAGDDYTSESWEVLEKALEKAVSVLDDPFATQQEVDAALSTLKDAYNGLEKVSSEVDKTKLQAKVDEIASEKLVADDYTSESWGELEKALERATSVLADPDATQQEVNAALSALKDAYNGLEKVSSEVDKSKLQAKADEIAAENLDEDDYTKGSWRELEKALEKAEAVLADPDATQKEVDAALSALKKAREGLKKAGEPTVDKSKLEAKVDEIVDENLDEDDYTGSSWRKLEKALKQAKDVLADPDATQDEVDEALAELKKARRDLTSADKPGSGRDKNRDRDKGDAYNVSNPFFSDNGSSDGQQKPSDPPKGEEKNDYTGYMNGYPTGKFDPNRQVTRAEMAMILANTGMINPETSASGTFYDVDNGHWAADAIKRANEAGLMNGYANGTFNPQGGITRAEMATIVYKYLGLTGDGMPNNFYDVPADHWATQIIAAVSESGLMNGYPDGTFHPQKTLTRAETVTIMNRLTNKIQLSPVNGQSWPDVPPTHWAYKDIEAATKK